MSSQNNWHIHLLTPCPIGTQITLTKAFMKKYPVEKINELPLMNDPPRAILMKILISLAPHVYLECKNYLPVRPKSAMSVNIFAYPFV